MHFKHSVKLHTETRNGRTSLYVRIGIHSKRKKFATGYVVADNEWHERKMLVINRPDADEINDNIAEQLKTARKVLTKFELIDEREPTIDEVADAFLIATGKKVDDTNKPKLFLDYIQPFVDEQSKVNSWSQNTKKKFTSLYNQWGSYEQEKQHRYSFDEIDDKQLQSFCDFILMQGFRNTTIRKYTSMLRWYLRWANKKEYYSGKCYDTFRPHYKGDKGEFKDIIYLTAQELEALQSLTFREGEKHLERVRDVFLFACFCGLRFSDVQHLKRTNITDEGIEVVTIKTEDRLYINFNDVTRAILDKYKDETYPNNRALPVISNQNTNEYIKDVCEMANIDTPTTIVYYKGTKRYEETYPKYELITFHAARRTFITQALRLGIPSEVIMKFSGHHSHDMLKPYMKVVDELKEKEMQKFNQMGMRPKSDQ